MPIDRKETLPSYQPTLRDMVMLALPLSVRLSPDGDRVAIKARTTNWNKNQYENHCHVHYLENGVTRQITRVGSAVQIEWLDNETLGLLKKEDDDAPSQVWVYEGLAGEGWKVTSHEKGVDWFVPFADGLLYLARDPHRDEKKERTGKFGDYNHFEQEESSTALYYVDLAELRTYERQVMMRTEEEAGDLVLPLIELSKLLDEPLSIRSVHPDPAGNVVFLNCWKRDDLIYFRDTAIFQITLDTQAAVSEHIRRKKNRPGHRHRRYRRRYLVPGSDYPSERATHRVSDGRFAGLPPTAHNLPGA